MCDKNKTTAKPEETAAQTAEEYTALDKEQLELISGGYRDGHLEIRMTAKAY